MRDTKSIKEFCQELIKESREDLHEIIKDGHVNSYASGFEKGRIESLNEVIKFINGN